MIEQVKLLIENGVDSRGNKTFIKLPVKLESDGNRIEIHSGYNKKLVEEIKATFSGYKWHGFEDPPKKIWSILDNDHNRWQLEYLQGLNPYQHYNKSINTVVPNREVYQHQRNLINFVLSRRHCIVAAEMGTGKSLVAIEVIELSGYTDVWFVAPKNALASVELEFRKWNATITPKFFTYEQLVKQTKTYNGRAPQILICEEAARCKTPTSQRTQSVEHVAKSIRKEHGYNSIILLMSGTPAPKSPTDWWSLCNIARPGYLKEGSADQLKARLAIIKKEESAAGGFFPKILAWKDNEKRCAECGQTEDKHEDIFGEIGHSFVPSINEVSKLNRRMKGLVEVVFKKDCLDLPEKVYIIRNVEPDGPTKRAAALIKRGAKRAIEGLIRLRELSDGFQYNEVAGPTEVCSNCKGEKQINNEACTFCSGVGHTKTFVRNAIRIECPKDDLLAEDLENYEDVGRLVCYAGFTESIDRVVDVAINNGWNVIRVDGRGCVPFNVANSNSPLSGDIKDCVYRFQNDKELGKTLFVGHPGSAGEGLTLTASPAIIYYSNDFNGGYRIQSEDRIHRIGMDVNRGATIIDYIHLPTDQLVLDNLKRKRELQSITLGELSEALLLDRVD